MKKILTVVISLFLLAAAGVSYVYFSNPIFIDGLSVTTFKEEGRTEYVFQFINKGTRSITLKNVLVNNGKQPELADLGVTFDGGHLVQSGMDDPAIQYMELDAHPIDPELSPEEATAAIARKEHTAIHYGMRIVYKEEPIRSLRIRYSYWGFTVTKIYDVTRWTKE